MEEHDSSVSNLIYNLNRLRTQESYIIDSIQDFDLLLSSLHELDSMVEMEKLKDSIVKQIKFLLVNNSTIPTNNNNNEKGKMVNTTAFDGHMLHTVIYGPPGVGKTRVCTILVKIWFSLGIIKQPSKNMLNNTLYNDSEMYPGIVHPTNPNDDNFNKIHDHINTLISVNKIKSDVIERLQTVISDLKFQITLLDPDIQAIKTKLRKLKRLTSHISKPKSKEGNIYDKINQRPVVKNKSDITFEDIIEDVAEIETRLKDEATKYTPDEKVRFAIQIINLEQPKPSDAPVVIPKPVTSHSSSPTSFPTAESVVKIVSREDFVGGFLGQTALKTEKLLQESLGKVLFIDEAYSLVNDEKDSYGREALTILNRFMSEHPDELIVIFAGYREKMEQTIFHFQPGLKSRCTWMFEIDGYTEVGLSRIFRQQLHENKWRLEDNVKLENFFKRNIKEFPAFGRDTNRLVFYCKTCYTEYVFDHEVEHTKTITKDILKNALVYLRNNRIKDISETYIPPSHIYM